MQKYFSPLIICMKLKQTIKQFFPYVLYLICCETTKIPERHFSPLEAGLFGEFWEFLVLNPHQMFPILRFILVIILVINKNYSGEDTFIFTSVFHYIFPIITTCICLQLRCSAFKPFNTFSYNTKLIKWDLT